MGADRRRRWRWLSRRRQSARPRLGADYPRRYDERRRHTVDRRNQEPSLLGPPSSMTAQRSSGVSRRFCRLGTWRSNSSLLNVSMARSGCRSSPVGRAGHRRMTVRSSVPASASGGRKSKRRSLRVAARFPTSARPSAQAPTAAHAGRKSNVSSRSLPPPGRRRFRRRLGNTHKQRRSTV